MKTLAQIALACIDPLPGDMVAKGEKTRTVTKRQGGEIEYQTEKGKIRNCWISTWQEWCRKATSATTVGQRS